MPAPGSSLCAPELHSATELACGAFPTSATSTKSSRRLIGTPFCSKWTANATNARWFGDVQASVEKCRPPLWSCNNRVSIFSHIQHPCRTFSSLPMTPREFLKTARTSRPTVRADGTQCNGLPVFIRLMKSSSSTIENGRRLRATQWTQAMLQWCQIKVRCVTVLAQRVSLTVSPHDCVV